MKIRAMPILLVLTVDVLGVSAQNESTHEKAIRSIVEQAHL
jgi:hypothetical protein